MSFLRDLPIKWKLNSIIIVISSTVILLAITAFILKYRSETRSTLTKDLTSLARVIGTNCASALLFDDRKAAEQTLAALGVKPHIVSACIYDQDKAIFARYKRYDTTSDCPSTLPDKNIHYYADQHLLLFQTIIINKEKIGTIYINYDLQEFHLRLQQYIGISVSIALLALTLTILLSNILQRFISLPLVNLTNTVRKISTNKDYSIRAEKHSNDEIGVLIDGFNIMVSEIQKRDDFLEKQVAGRTAELTQANEELREEIAERKRWEAERARLASAIDQAKETVVIMDADGTILYINPAMEEVLGYTRENIKGKNAFQSESGIYDQKFYDDIWQTISGGNAWSGRVSFKKTSGSLRDFETSITPIRFQSETINGYVAIGRDVTHELRLEKELRQAQKMEAIGTLAGGIAHDFNNILAAIIGYSEMVIKSLPEKSKEQRKMEHVLTASHRAKDLVKQILAFSRQGEQEKKPIQLQIVINEALKLLRASLPTTIDIQTELNSKASLIADPIQMHQLLMNLCTNASYAMQERGGVLKICLQEVEVDREQAEQSYDLQPDRYLQLTVSDSGTGIPQEIIDRIFDPFFTTKGVGKGTGLGLAVVHGIVKSHGGSISVESQPGSGTSFHVFLPRLEEAIQEEAAMLEKLPLGSESILFVDDEELLTDVAQDMLESLGYSVETINSSKDALVLFREDPDRFDLVITDQTMPHMTGFELAKNFFQIRPELPLILCSGYSETVSTRTAKQIGIHRFIMKPFNVREIADAVRTVLDEQAAKGVEEKAQLYPVDQ